jgi:hypothetical protein
VFQFHNPTNLSLYSFEVLILRTTLKNDENKKKLKDALEWLHKNAYGKDPDKKVADLKTNFSKSAPQFKFVFF